MNTPTQKDIYVANWGYDANFSDFYQVESVTKSGKSAKLRHLGTKQVSDPKGSMDYGSIVADPSTTGKEGTRTLRIKDNGNFGFSFKINNYKYAMKWGGEAISQYNHH